MSVLPNVPYLLVNGLWHLALAVWIGGGLVTTFVVVPVVFGRAPSRALAGEIVGEILRRQGWLVLGALGVLAATGGARAAIWENPTWPILLRYGLLLGAAFLAVLGIAWLSPKIHALREAMGRPIDEVPETDPRRRAFRKLHGASMGLNLLQLVLATLAYFLT